MNFNFDRKLFLRGVLSLSLACCLVALVAGTVNAQAVLYSDQFDNGGQAAQPFDGSSTPEVNVTGTVLESYGSGSQENHVDRWRADQVSDISGVSWGAQGTRYNWATGANTADILQYGLTISGTMRNGNGQDYLAFGFGMSGADPIGGDGRVYEDSSADWGIRFENDRMISFVGGTTTPIYRTDVDPGAYSFGNFNRFEFDLHLNFDDGNFDAGSSVTASLTLTQLDGGATVVNLPNFDTWTLDNTDDLIIDMAYHVSGSGEGLLYDIEVSAIPEPATFALFGLGALAMTAVRRRS